MSKLVHVALVCVLAAGFTGTGAVSEPVGNGQIHIKLKAFDQLTDRQISRMGERALSMKLDWEHGESDSFVFHFEKGFSPNQLAYAAERFYAGCKEHLNITDDRFERKCHIYVFLSENAWKEFAQNVRVDAWTGGFCTGRELFLPSSVHFKLQGTALPHEMAHLVLYRFIGGDIPLWLNEGFAQFEANRLFRVYLKARNYTMTGVPETIDSKDYIPLKDLTSAIDYPHTPEAAATFYIESERLVNFLFNQHGGIEPLLKFARLQSRGYNFESAWNEVYGGRRPDPESFERKFIEFVTKSGE
jgi:hypothetical protein